MRHALCANTAVDRRTVTRSEFLSASSLGVQIMHALLAHLVDVVVHGECGEEVLEPLVGLLLLDARLLAAKLGDAPDIVR